MAKKTKAGRNDGDAEHGGIAIADHPTAMLRSADPAARCELGHCHALRRRHVGAIAVAGYGRALGIASLPPTGAH